MFRCNIGCFKIKHRIFGEYIWNMIGIFSKIVEYFNYVQIFERKINVSGIKSNQNHIFRCNIRCLSHLHTWNLLGCHAKLLPSLWAVLITESSLCDIIFIHWSTWNRSMYTSSHISLTAFKVHLRIGSITRWN